MTTRLPGLYFAPISCGAVRAESVKMQTGGEQAPYGVDRGRTKHLERVIFLTTIAPDPTRTKRELHMFVCSHAISTRVRTRTRRRTDSDAPYASAI